MRTVKFLLARNAVFALSLIFILLCSVACAKLGKPANSSINGTFSPEENSENSAQKEGERFDEYIKTIANFIKTGRDAGTSAEVSGKPNTSTATYADVPDYYLNLDNPQAGDIFASPNGRADGKGTEESPYDINTALTKLSKGKTLYLIGGVYKIDERIDFRTYGTRREYINIYAYKGELAVINCTAYNNSTKGNDIAFNFNMGLAEQDGSAKILKNLLSLTSSTSKDKATGTITTSLFNVYNKGYYFIDYQENVAKSNIFNGGYSRKMMFRLEDMVESVEGIALSRDLHFKLRDKDGSINLGNYLKVKESSIIYTMGENGEPLGANLNQDKYQSTESTIALIEGISNVEYTSQSFKSIYSSAKSFMALTDDEQRNVNNIEKLVQAIKVYETHQ